MARIYRSKPQRRLWRNVALALILVLLLDLWIALNRYKTFAKNLAIHTVQRVDDLPFRARRQKIFIVAQFWSGADVLVGHWSSALVKLIDTLGAENVYVSILASGSLDNTNEVLKSVEQTLLEPRNIARTIVTDPTTHQDEIDKGPKDKQGKWRDGWILSGDAKTAGDRELRRIPYLARLRNQGLQPLKTQLEKGVTYDKILHLNDVMFNPTDVLSLLATNGGVFDVACAFDFQHPPLFYDTFALRDSNGDPAVIQTFPFYRSSASRSALLQGLPAPVKSCWNGMVVSEAAPYYERDVSFDRGTQSTTLPAMTFRGLPDSLAQSHLEASECCLIHADLEARGQARKGIFMNPAVRVGYERHTGQESTAYEDVHSGPTGLGWITPSDYIYGIWRNRLVRWIRSTRWDKSKVLGRIQKWEREGDSDSVLEPRHEVGDFCTIDEMHILIWNGWKHVW